MRIVLFLLVLLTLSYSCPQNCLFCFEESSCSACRNGYILTNNAACILKTVPNCRIQLNGATCSICEPSFLVSAGKCIKDTSGCVIRNSVGACQYCWFGTKLNGDSCVGLMNCRTTLANGQCSQCFTGYSLVAGACSESRSSCAAKENGLCSKCNAHYILNGFSCLPQIALPPSCSLFDYIVGRCLICNEGYEIYHKYCQRKDYIPFKQPITNNQAQNALHMSQDILGTTTYSPAINSDSIIQDYLDIQVKVSIGLGKRVNIQDRNCWQRDSNGICQLCYQGFTLVNQTCVKAPPQCLQFDSSGKLCTKCKPELVLSKGNCLDNNCAIPIFSRCTKCLNNFTPNALGICINSNCINFYEGACSKCDLGYTLSSENLCMKTISATPTPTTPAAPTSNSAIIGCDLAANGLCLRCGTNYFPNNKGGCKRVIVGCITYDAAELNCVQCIPIYTQTSDGGCIYQPTPTPTPALTPATSIPTPQQAISPKLNNTKSTSPVVATPAAPPKPTPTPTPTPVPITVPVPISAIDQNCLVKNNGSCAICKARYVINLYNFSCLQVPKECLTYNSANGDCLSCAQGYNLFQIWCLGRFNQTDPNCIVKDINNYCTNCQAQFYQSQGRCYPANTQCKTINTLGGDCLSCYSGYIVVNGACVLLSQQPSCAQYDFQSNCVKCTQRYFLQSLICVPVSPLCNNYNTQTGVCIDCVAGYGLSSITGNCETIRSPIPNCQTADPVGNCLACLSRFYFNSSNTCVPVNPLCSKFVSVGGKCLSCFSGYNLLADSSCLKSNLATGCNAANINGLCSSCSGQYVLTASGSCLWRDTNCLGYDDSGNCNKCVPLYYIQQGKCIKQVMKAKDPNCLINDLMNYCQGCIFGYYISAGNCLLADQLCRTFDTSNGNCLTCYNGYRLNQNKCFLDNPIFNCKQFNGSNCVVCQTGYTVKSDGSCSQS